MTAHDGTVGSKRSPLTHERARVRAMYRKMRPRCSHIREHAGRAAENMVLQLNALVHRDVVLDSHSVADPDIVRDVDILSQRTVPADDGSPLDMAEMPNFRSGADGYAIVDITAFVNEVVRHGKE